MLASAQRPPVAKRVCHRLTFSRHRIAPSLLRISCPLWPHTVSPHMVHPYLTLSDCSTSLQCPVPLFVGWSLWSRELKLAPER